MPPTSLSLDALRTTSASANHHSIGFCLRENQNMSLKILCLTLLAFRVATAHAFAVSPTDQGTPSPSTDLMGKTLIVVTTRQYEPYTSFFNDFLNVLQTELGFNSTLEVLDLYGVPDADGKWDGMVGRLVNRTADIALSDLTITNVRSEVIDFTVPFIDSGMQVIANKRDVEGLIR